MSDVIITNAVSIGVMLVGFIGNAIYLNGKLAERIQNNKDSIRDIETDLDGLKLRVQFKDTCGEIHKAVDHRLDRLEIASNGRLKP